MEYYYHEHLSDLDATGFGLVYMNTSNDHMPPHWHRAVELLYFLSGTATIQSDGYEQRLQAGDLYLIDSYQIHASWCGCNVTYLCLHILPSQMCQYAPEFDQRQFSLRFDPSDQQRAQAFSTLNGNMKRLILLRREKPEGGQLQAYSLIFEIAYLLFRHFSQPLVSERTQMRRDILRLDPLLDYMQLHHSEEWTLEQAAAQLGVTKEYFCRLFKKSMGTTFLRCLNQIRVSAVCRELAVSDTPISALAEKHGLHNVKLFRQVFREVYGCTPTEKRNQLREAARPQTPSKKAGTQDTPTDRPAAKA